MELATAFGFVVILFYWILIYSQDHTSKETGALHFLTFVVHLIMPVTVIIDNLWSCVDYRAKDFWVVAIVAICYGIVNLIYVKVKGRWVYDSLNWEDGSTAISIFIAAILFVLGFFIFLCNHRYMIINLLLINKSFII